MHTRTLDSVEYMHLVLFSPLCSAADSGENSRRPVTVFSAHTINIQSGELLCSLRVYVCIVCNHVIEQIISHQA